MKKLVQRLNNIISGEYEKDLNITGLGLMNLLGIDFEKIGDFDYYIGNQLENFYNLSGTTNTFNEGIKIIENCETIEWSNYLFLDTNAITTNSNEIVKDKKFYTLKNCYIKNRYNDYCLELINIVNILKEKVQTYNEKSVFILELKFARSEIVTITIDKNDVTVEYDIINFDDPSDDEIIHLLYLLILISYNVPLKYTLELLELL